MKLEVHRQRVQPAKRENAPAFNYRGPGQSLKSFSAGCVRRQSLDKLHRLRADLPLEKNFANK